MALDNGQLTDQVPLSPAPSQPGPIRRFFNGWKRLEKAMDYSPYDYVADRLGALEARVIELEKQLSSRTPRITAGMGAHRNKSA